MNFIYEEEVKALRKTLKDWGVDVVLRPAKKEDILYLKSIGVPDCICQFYEKAEPSEGIEINDARLWPVSDLRIENEQAIPGCIIFPLGYRVIGTTVWGDVYCINVTNKYKESIVFLASHDEIYENMNEEEIHSKIIPVADTFKEFLKKFINGELPTDYYELKEDNNI